MADDLEAFLQRAAQKRKKRRPAEIVVLQPGTPAPQPLQPLQPFAPLQSPTLAPLVQPIVVAEAVEDIGSEPVSTHVQRHLNTREFQERASHLGERVGLADDVMESHLSQVFEHRVGTLGGGGISAQGAAVEATSPLIQEIIETFASPDSIRRAIILNEILTPPDHRWK